MVKVIIYSELERLISRHCFYGAWVLEIGGVPKGYLDKKKNINLFRTNIKKIQGLDCVADGQKLPFQSETFDLVFMVAVDYYIPDIELAFTEIFRVLKPQGVFINATYTEKNLNKQRVYDTNIVSSLSTKKYLSLSTKVRLASKVIKISNNAPVIFWKAIIWKILPRFIKLKVSHWRIFINSKL